MATECTVPGIPADSNVDRGSCKPGDNIFEGETCTYVCATGYAARAGTSGTFTCNVGASFPNITCDRMCGRRPPLAPDPSLSFVWHGAGWQAGTRLFRGVFEVGNRI
jgi:hypothetical protein